MISSFERANNICELIPENDIIKTMSEEFGSFTLTVAGKRRHFDIQTGTTICKIDREGNLLTTRIVPPGMPNRRFLTDKAKSNRKPVQVTNQRTI